MNRKDLLLAVLIVYFIFASLFYLFKAYPITEVLFLIAPLLAALGGIWAVRAFGFKTVRGEAMLYITLGLFSWLVAEALWTLFEVVLKILPYPAIVVDFFFLIAYPLLLIGIIKEVQIGRIEWDRLKRTLFGLILVLVFILFAYFGVYRAYDPQVVLVQNILGIAYDSGDILLLVSTLLAMMLVVEYRGGKLFSSWLYFLAGLALIFVTDLLMAIYAEPYKAGVWLYRQMDILRIAGYLFVAYSLFSIWFIIKDFEKKFQRFKAKKK